ncbi:hypothetical protein B0A52_10073 [Exophiala mesophila]|uniref:Uncharacterized protein n=1 Tax=Exophiala mesophila TaxID=212818 RepID=A0A438MRC7_EXOME|nr:hypothetical protein B0A52_10073 [Exophiala mesophila]
MARQGSDVVDVDRTARRNTKALPTAFKSTAFKSPDFWSDFGPDEPESIESFYLPTAFKSPDFWSDFGPDEPESIESFYQPAAFKPPAFWSPDFWSDFGPDEPESIESFYQPTAFKLPAFWSPDFWSDFGPEEPESIQSFYQPTAFKSPDFWSDFGPDEPESIESFYQPTAFKPPAFWSPDFWSPDFWSPDFWSPAFWSPDFWSDSDPEEPGTNCPRSGVTIGTQTHGFNLGNSPSGHINAPGTRLSNPFTPSTPSNMQSMADPASEYPEEAVVNPIDAQYALNKGLIHYLSLACMLWYVTFARDFSKMVLEAVEEKNIHIQESHGTAHYAGVAFTERAGCIWAEVYRKVMARESQDRVAEGLMSPKMLN